MPRRPTAIRTTVAALTLALLLSGHTATAQAAPRPAPDAEPETGGKPQPDKPNTKPGNEPNAKPGDTPNPNIKLESGNKPNPNNKPESGDKPAAKPPETATSLFRRGMDLMRAGDKAGDAKRITAGCEALEKSQAMQANLSTQFRLAQCYDKIGRRATALALMESVTANALVQGKQAEHMFASRSANELAPRVPYLALMPDPQTAALSGLKVSLDGSSLPPVALSTPIPLDNGPHRLRAEAPGHLPFEMTATIGDEHAGRTLALPIPPLDKVPPPVQLPNDTGGLSPFRTAALITGASGAAMLAVSGFIMIPAVGMFDETTDISSDLYCDNTGSCRTQAGVEQRQEARMLGDVATVLFATGGAALTAGVLLWLLDPGAQAADEPEAALALNLTIGPAALTLSGRF